jgi:hypothetical protein
MTRIIALVAGPLALAACAPEAPREEQGDAAATPAEPQAAAAEPAPADGDVEARAWRYTALTGCEIVREEHEEMPFVETLCPGPQGWALRVTDSDARQNLLVVAPGGQETSLELSRVGGGGFSSLGDRAEWRGPAGGSFAPDSLVVRYRVAEAPYPEPETSYLLAVRLAPKPCVVAKVAPGPAQNAIARARADDPGACLADRSLR